MSLGKVIHWLGILIILAVCFYDPIQGKQANILAYKSYAVILFGFALTILGIEVKRDGKKVCLLLLAGDWLLYQDEDEEEAKNEPAAPAAKPEPPEQTRPPAPESTADTPGPAGDEQKT